VAGRELGKAKLEDDGGLATRRACSEVLRYIGITQFTFINEMHYQITLFNPDWRKTQQLFYAIGVYRVLIG